MPKKQKKKPQGTAHVQVTIEVPLSSWDPAKNLKDLIVGFTDEAELKVKEMIEDHEMKITTPPTVVSLSHQRN